MAKMLEILRKYWPIKNFSQKLSDDRVAEFQTETHDAFYEQVARIHQRIIEKHDASRKA